MSERDFEELYRDNFKRLCQKAYRITLDKKASEDIVHDAFLKVWKQERLIKFKEAYLYRAVINGALNYIHHHKRFEGLPGEPRLSVDHTPHSELQWKELQNNIQKAISFLPEGCRTVFLLSRYEQMSYKEIAEFMSISVNTVEKQMGKALELLRNAIYPTQRD